MEAAIDIRYALDTFYFLICAALVMWMAAGFTMLEAGLVRARNTVEILTKNVALFAIACLMYLIFGYTLMYPEAGVNSVWPGIGFLPGADHTVEAVMASEGETYYSGAADFMFQMVFVATAMSIVSGAVAERMKMWSFLAFAVVMTGFIYPLQGYWSWGEGFLDGLGYSDYAGSGIVHLAGAAAALAGVLLLGPRRGRFGPDGKINAIPGANLPLATLGMFVLWMGWFGFNGGSELKVSDIESANNVARVFVNTNLAASGGLVGALIIARLIFGKADLTMALNGALAGLVSITADPLSPGHGLAAVIGLIGGVLVVLSIIGLDRLKIDDPVGAISVHGVCGIFGVLAVLASNDEATLLAQLTGIGVIFGFVFVSSIAVWLALKSTMGLRVDEEAEYEGLDMAECGMEAYPEFVSSRSG
ncbi:ammonium transporter [Wenzhouxiangella marina]|uniref:Ammonium transporter n=1 Tax=Wenzhouxiangella marina TaxID=1579979 RepID=A0A0K0XS24_9GAMM|nr:ammonium transporter [Wenzhouxiangella marina]AKS40422.1 ammonium transporter [Wenzhouxiangella marina]MBB6088256.1 Amt family ammonium transporter [Wenzhouxiangella marina]